VSNLIAAGIPIKWSATGFSAPVLTGTTAIPPEVTHYAALIGDLTVKARASCKKIFSDDVGACVWDCAGACVRSGRR
jgi:hypothetical protein